jgi:ectoine hydroxylase-related dioxygenase (phytanoyl-CoA dioxygenase family)
MTAADPQVVTATPVLTGQQVAFFEAFGFLHVPGMFADEAEAMSSAFDEVFATTDQVFPLPPNEHHRERPGSDHTRLIVPAIVDKHPTLAPLRHDPRVVGIAETLLGPDPVYKESDGNLFDCDLTWHIDAYGSPIEEQHVKLFFYLDPLTRETGALRVMPGSHELVGGFAEAMRRDLVEPSRVEGIYGVPDHELPCWTLDVVPGDLIVGNFRVFHASFGGRRGRRLFTMNFSKADGAAPTP